MKLSEILTTHQLQERNHSLRSLAFFSCFLLNFLGKQTLCIDRVKFGSFSFFCVSFRFCRMGTRDKSLKSFHLHLPHLQHHHGHGKRHEFKNVPKGCLAIKVGQGEEQQRFVVPVIYFNHPLFMQLLKEAEEEYGFDQKGTITIPCHVEEFRYVQGMIDREKSLHHHHHYIGCFGF